MQGNNLSNSLTSRVLVVSEVVLIKDEHEETSKLGWFKTMFDHRVTWTPNMAILSKLWQWSNKQGLRMELTFIGDEMVKEAPHLWEMLDKGSANPFTDWVPYESRMKIANDLAYRPDILYVIDIPGNTSAYGGKGVTLEYL
jgi:hypothetical protein